MCARNRTSPGSGYSVWSIILLWESDLAFQDKSSPHRLMHVESLLYLLASISQLPSFLSLIRLPASFPPGPAPWAALSIAGRIITDEVLITAWPSVLAHLCAIHSLPPTWRLCSCAPRNEDVEQLHFIAYLILHDEEEWMRAQYNMLTVLNKSDPNPKPSNLLLLMGGGVVVRIG